MVMAIKFYGPIDEGIGKNLIEFRMEGEIPLNEFSRKLVKRFPCLGDYPTGKNAVSSIQFFSGLERDTIISRYT